MTTIQKSLKLKNTDFKNQLRKLVLDAVLSGKLDRHSAIKRLEISERQFIRILNNYRINGEKSLIHGLCNKPSNHSYKTEFKSKVVSHYAKYYTGFNYIHASEKLDELDQIIVHPNTLRNWLLSSGVSQRKYGRKAYHKRREPRRRFGELVQMDGSFHDWFGDGKQYCLMHMVDDATKTSLAMLCDNETTDAALTILYKWCELYGLPGAIYSDRDGVYKVNEQHRRLTIEEELEGQTERLTNFGKVCHRLGIKQIYAYSAQAKGRVERKHQMYQDRMVKEIKLFNLHDMEEVNIFLLKPNGFIDKLNAKFTISPVEAGECIKLSKSKLNQYFTIDEDRIIRNDYTVQFKNKIFQLKKDLRLRPKLKVTIKTYMDGKTAIYLCNKKLEYVVVDNYERPVREVIESKPLSTSKTRKKSVSPWGEYTARKPSQSISRERVKQNLDYMAKVYG